MFATDHIYEALLYTDINLDSVEPDSILREDHIKMIVQKSGMKYKSAKLKEEKERKNTDAVKRWVVSCSFWLFLFYFFLQVFGEEAALTVQQRVLWWVWSSEFFFAFTTPIFAAITDLLQTQHHWPHGPQLSPSWDTWITGKQPYWIACVKPKWCQWKQEASHNTLGLLLVWSKSMCSGVTQFPLHLTQQADLLPVHGGKKVAT